MIIKLFTSLQLPDWLLIFIWMFSTTSFILLRPIIPFPKINRVLQFVALFLASVGLIFLQVFQVDILLIGALLIGLAILFTVMQKFRNEETLSSIGNILFTFLIAIFVFLQLNEFFLQGNIDKYLLAVISLTVLILSSVFHFLFNRKIENRDRNFLVNNFIQGFLIGLGPIFLHTFLFNLLDYPVV